MHSTMYHFYMKKDLFSLPFLFHFFGFYSVWMLADAMRSFVRSFISSILFRALLFSFSLPNAVQIHLSALSPLLNARVSISHDAEVCGLLKWYCLIIFLHCFYSWFKWWRFLLFFLINRWVKWLQWICSLLQSKTWFIKYRRKSSCSLIKPNYWTKPAWCTV